MKEMISQGKSDYTGKKLLYRKEVITQEGSDYTGRKQLYRKEVLIQKGCDNDNSFISTDPN